MSSVIRVRTTVTTELLDDRGVRVTRAESFDVLPPHTWDRTTVEENVIASCNTFRATLRRNLHESPADKVARMAV